MSTITSIPFCWQTMLDSKHHLYDKSWGMFSSEECSCVFCLIIFWFYEANFRKLVTITRNKRLRRWFNNPLSHPGIFDGGSHDFSRAPWVVGRYLFPPKMTLNVSLFVDGSNWISLSFFRDHSKFRFPSSFWNLIPKSPKHNTPWELAHPTPQAIDVNEKTWVCFTRLTGDRD